MRARAAPHEAAGRRVARGRAPLLVRRTRRTSGACARSRPRSCPGVMVSLSHEVMPPAPEFERTSTTLVNAYVGPKIERYLEPPRRAAARGGLRAASCSSCSRTAASCRAATSAQKAVAVHGLGPGGRRRWARRPSPARPGIARLHLGRHGRHELRRVPGARRHARGEGRLELAPPLPGRPADGRRAVGRRRRRLDRARRGGRAQGRARRAPAREPGPDLLRPRRHASRP